MMGARHRDAEPVIAVTKPQAAPRGSLVGLARSTWKRDEDVLGNASSLVATTVGASALGFIYWAVAARLLTQRAVGYGSASISAMTLIGTIGMFGFGTLLIGELPKRSSHRAGLISAALLSSALGSLILALLYVIAGPRLGLRFAVIGQPGAQALVFAAGVALSAVGLVFDQAAIGLQRGPLQLGRNLFFAITKVIALVVVVKTAASHFGDAITLSWTLGLAESLIVLGLWLELSRTSIFARPAWHELRAFGRDAFGHNWLNLALQLPRLVMPVLVTVVVSASANAAFYAAWMIAGLLYILPTHLATALYAVGAADIQALARKLRFTLRVSLLVGIPSSIAVAAGAHYILGLFGRNYALEATTPLWLFSAGYLPTVLKAHYVGLRRVYGQVTRAAVLLTLAGALEITAAMLGARWRGLNGLSLALLAAFALEGLVAAPLVLRATIKAGRHRRPSTTADAASSQ